MLEHYADHYAGAFNAPKRWLEAHVKTWSSGYEEELLNHGMKVEVFRESEVESCRICDDLESAGELFVVLTEQVEEETGIFPQQDLTALLDPSTRCRMFPLPGGYDGELSLHVKNEVIEALQGQEMGLCGARVCRHLHE